MQAERKSQVVFSAGFESESSESESPVRRNELFSSLDGAADSCRKTGVTGFIWCSRGEVSI